MRRRSERTESPTGTEAHSKHPSASSNGLSSNWMALKKKLKRQKREFEAKEVVQKRSGGKRRRFKETLSSESEEESNRKLVKKEFGLENIVALDCEMVSVNMNGNKRVIAARVAIVKRSHLLNSLTADVSGWTVLDYQLVTSLPLHLEMILDCCSTRYSGIRPGHLRDAPPLSEIRKKVQSLLESKIVVGHALDNDFEALGIKHPQEQTRDTSKYEPLMTGLNGEKLPHGRALRTLARHYLHMDIQSGAHNPVEDARAALYLYHNHKEAWEAALLSIDRHIDR